MIGEKMSAKRYKPALFELMDKGSLKPRTDGSLPVPEWLYGSKKTHGLINFLRKIPRLIHRPSAAETGSPVTPITRPVSHKSSETAIAPLGQRPQPAMEKPVSPVVSPATRPPAANNTQTPSRPAVLTGTSKPTVQPAKTSAIGAQINIPTTMQSPVPAIAASVKTPVPVQQQPTSVPQKPIEISPPKSQPERMSRPSVTPRWNLEQAKGENNERKSGQETHTLGWMARRVHVSISHGILILTALGAILVLLGIFRLGQMAGNTSDSQSAAISATSPASSLQAPPAAENKLQSLRESSTRPDALQAPRGGRSAQPAIIVSPETPAVSQTGITPAQAPATAKSAAALHLVICTQDSATELAALKIYFNRKGVSVEIGRFGSKYILYSTRSFDSIKDADVSGLQKTVAELGGKYNAEKDPGAAVFSPKTFAADSTYFVRAEKIQ
jgi:hypothetical protein